MKSRSGGNSNSLSLLELFGILEKKLQIKMKFQCRPWRQSDQRVFVADLSKITAATGWKPSLGADQGIEQMIAWCREEEGRRE